MSRIIPGPLVETRGRFCKKKTILGILEMVRSIYNMYMFGNVYFVRRTVTLRLERAKSRLRRWKRAERRRKRLRRTRGSRGSLASPASIWRNSNRGTSGMCSESSWFYFVRHLYDFKQGRGSDIFSTDPDLAQLEKKIRIRPEIEM